MTPDEQEALSFRYVMPRAMRLSSGRFALFIDGQDLQIVDGAELLALLPDTDDIEAYNQSLRVSRPKVNLGEPAKLTTLNLADLGL